MPLAVTAVLTFKIETKTKSSSVLLCFSGGGSENETNRAKVVECQYGLNNRISEIIAVFFRSCWAHSGRILHNDYSRGGVAVEVTVLGVWQRWRWW